MLRPQRKPSKPPRSCAALWRRARGPGRLGGRGVPFLSVDCFRGRHPWQCHSRSVFDLLCVHLVPSKGGAWKHTSASHRGVAYLTELLHILGSAPHRGLKSPNARGQPKADVSRLFSLVTHALDARSRGWRIIQRIHPPSGLLRAECGFSRVMWLCQSRPSAVLCWLLLGGGAQYFCAGYVCKKSFRGQDCKLEDQVWRSVASLLPGFGTPLRSGKRVSYVPRTTPLYILHSARSVLHSHIVPPPPPCSKPAGEPAALLCADMRDSVWQPSFGGAAWLFFFFRKGGGGSVVAVRAYKGARGALTPHPSFCVSIIWRGGLVVFFFRKGGGGSVVAVRAYKGARGALTPHPSFCVSIRV